MPDASSQGGSAFDVTPNSAKSTQQKLKDSKYSAGAGTGQPDPSKSTVQQLSQKDQRTAAQGKGS